MASCADHRQSEPLRDGARTRCIVVSDRCTPEVDALVKAFERRDVRVSRCVDAFAAIAELHALGALSIDLGAARDVMVVIDTSTPRQPELARTIDRFCPSATTWTFDPAHRPSLRRLETGDVEPAPRVEVRANGTESATKEASSEPLRFPGPERREEEPAPQPVEEAEANEQTSRGVLTEDELAMLLSDEFLEDAGPGRRSGS